MSEFSDTRPLTPAPAELELRIGNKVRRVPYEQAFVLAYSLVDQKQFENAARIFERLEAFTDRGPRAFIMQAFCEAAALHFEACSKPLSAAFNGNNASLIAELHNAFISYHVGIRQDALKAMAELVNQHRELPTLCLLLGDMFRASGQLDMAHKCWKLAQHRDLPRGSIALVAERRMRKAA